MSATRRPGWIFSLPAPVASTAGFFMGKPKVPEIAAGNARRYVVVIHSDKSDGSLSYDTGLWFWI
ncbi:hypothetical protein [Mesorhizobium prunaredense]|uniref:hypothetical protein n=1 Tax=Mesorhizobium prunaredense TaxID=1631249 RepID=UPI001AEC7674|nr:hypothetical protein [Mesorhizobium prunaredense]